MHSSRLVSLLFLFFGFQMAAQTYSSSPGLTIPDDGASHDYILSVSGLSPAALDTAHGLKTLCLDITHTWDGDLHIQLISPNGDVLELLNGVGYDGDNFTASCFEADAATSIVSGSAPFTGTFKPQGNMGNLNNGSNGNGNWILRITDGGPGDIGTLNSWSLTFGSGAAAPYSFSSSNLPIILVNTEGSASIPYEPKVGAQMKILYNGPGLRNFLTDSPQIEMRIGIEIRGAYSSSLPQKPYGFETWDSLGVDSSVSLLGMPKESDWILQSTYNDKVFVRNAQMFSFARQMGDYATRTQHCELFLNGEYQGIYYLCEKIKRDKNRVDIAKNDTTLTTYPQISGGYIFKHDYDDAGWTSQWTSDGCPGRPFNYEYFYPKAASINAAQGDYIKSYVDSFESVLFDTTFADPVKGYAKYIDVNSFVDYLLLNEYAMNGDGYKKSMFFHKDYLGKIYAGPIWDFDWALKYLAWTPADADGWEYLNDPCAGDVMFTPWFARLMEDSNFVNKAKCRWEYLRTDILDTTHIFHYIDSMSVYLNEAQQRHFDYWGNLGINSGAPEWDPVPTTFDGEISRYKDFLRHRIQWVDANLGGVCREPIDTNTAIPMVDVTAIRISPNPANNHLEIHWDQNVPFAHILNAAGQEIIRMPTNSPQWKLETASWPAGVYLLEWQDNEARHGHQTILIEHP